MARSAIARSVLMRAHAEIARAWARPLHYKEKGPRAACPGRGRAISLRLAVSASIFGEIARERVELRVADLRLAEERHHGHARAHEGLHELRHEVRALLEHRGLRSFI